MDVPSVARPGEPEQAESKRDPTRDHRGKPPFGHGDVVVGGQFPVVRRLQQTDGHTGKELADDHAEKRKAADARVHAMHSLKDNRVSRQEKVKQAVDERHVDTEQKDDRLGHQDSQRAAEILRHQFSEIDLDFFLLGMDSPVLCTAAEFGRFLNQHDGRVGFLQENHIEPERQKAHDGSDVFGPAPSQIRVDHDEATDEGCQQWTGEHRHGEDSNRKPSGPVVEDVGKHSGDDRQRARTEGARKKTRNQNRLEVFRHGGGDGEYGEAKHGNYQRKLSAFQFRERGP